MPLSVDHAIIAEQVAYAARLMEKGEFALFGEAFLAWHGKEASEAEIDFHFSRYIRTGEVPFWVRHQVRVFLSDPALQKRLARKRRISLVCYLAPLVVEYILLMYFLVWVR